MSQIGVYGVGCLSSALISVSFSSFAIVLEEPVSHVECLSR
jgi:hypothetical protein